jgi:hypothetical protein
MLDSETPSLHEQQHTTIRDRRALRTDLVDEYGLFGHIDAALKRDEGDTTWKPEWLEYAKWYHSNRVYRQVEPAPGFLHEMVVVSHRLTIVIATPEALLGHSHLWPHINHLAVDDAHLIRHCDVHALHERTGIRTLLATGQTEYGMISTTAELRSFPILPQLALHLHQHTNNPDYGDQLSALLFHDHRCHPLIAEAASVVLKGDPTHIVAKATGRAVETFTEDRCLFPLPVKGYPIILMDVVEKSVVEPVCSLYHPRQCRMVKTLIHRIGDLAPLCRSIGIAAAFASDRNHLTSMCEQFWGEFGASDFAAKIDLMEVIPITSMSACRYDVLILVTGLSRDCDDEYASNAGEKGQETVNMAFYDDMLAAFQRGTNLLIILGGMDILSNEESSDAKIYKFVEYVCNHTPAVDADNYLEVLGAQGRNAPPAYLAKQPPLLKKPGDPRIKPLIAATDLNKRHGWLEESIRFRA